MKHDHAAFNLANAQLLTHLPASCECERDSAHIRFACVSLMSGRSRTAARFPRAQDEEEEEEEEERASRRRGGHDDHNRTDRDHNLCSLCLSRLDEGDYWSGVDSVERSRAAAFREREDGHSQTRNLMS